VVGYASRTLLNYYIEGLIKEVLAKPQMLNPDQGAEVGRKSKVLGLSSSTAQKGVQNFPHNILVNYFHGAPGKSRWSDRLTISPASKKIKLKKMYIILMTLFSIILMSLKPSPCLT